MDEATIDQLLRDAVIAPREAQLEALSAAGPTVVEHFRAWLTGEHKIDLPRGQDREFIDNTTSIATHLARRFPDDFLTTFNKNSSIRNSYALLGLGYTGREEAKPLLITALHSDAPGVTRVSAAIALGFLPGGDSVAALVRALDDDEYLVQYHAIKSLGHIGDRKALDRLVAIAAHPSNRGIAMIAPSAARELARRLRVDILVPNPDMSRWPPLNISIVTEGE